MGQLRFLLSLITRDNDSQREGEKAATAAARRLNVDLEVLYAENDSVRQSSQILDALYKYKSSLSGILVSPAGGTEFPQIGRAAVSAGVAWVLLNRDASSLRELRHGTTTPAFAVSANHTEVGRIQARQLAALLPGGGFVLYVQGPASTQSARDRMAGLQEAKQLQITLRVVKSSTWTEEGGHRAVASCLRLITSPQRIQAVVAQSDVIAIGARKAFEESGVPRWSGLPFLGAGGNPGTGQAWVKEGLLAATVVKPPVAGLALEAAVAAITQNRQPPELQLVPVASFPALEALRPAPADKPEKAAAASAEATSAGAPGQVPGLGLHRLD